VSYPRGGPAYTYSDFDALGRPVKMTGGASEEWAKEAQYDGAGRLARIKLLKGPGAGIYATEQHGYNARGQLTRLTVPGYLDERYVYPATTNAGRIERNKDWDSGEEVAYQYDELNRLTSAGTTGTDGWGLSFSYDGFGNRTAQTVTKGSAAGRGVRNHAG